jgi:Holliday junction resolvasome RuvABC endonuclease subunit
MTPLVVGLDLSLNSTGVARWGPDGLQLHTIEPKKLKDLPRLRYIRAEVTTWTRGADLVVLEGLQPAGHTAAAAYANERAGAHWLVLDRLVELGHSYAEVPSAKLKGYATGAGSGSKTSKAAVVAAVVRRYDASPANDDEADACVLAAMGLHHLGHPPAEVPKLNANWLTAVRWPA